MSFISSLIEFIAGTKVKSSEINLNFEDIRLAHNDLQNNAVLSSTTVNGHALSSNVVITNSDIGSVPIATTVNGFALSSDIILSASDVGAVSTSTTVNGYSLSGNVTITASDVGLGDVQNINYSNVVTKNSDYTLTITDNGFTILMNSSTDVVLSIPDTLTSGFSCLIIQAGTGQVTFTGLGSMVVSNRQSFTKTAGQYAGASLIVDVPNNTILLGDCV